MKTFIFAILTASALQAIPALADDMMKCTEDNVKKTEMMAMGMTKPEQKSAMEMSMKHVGMAKDAMMKKMDDDCMKELDEAMKAMKG